MTRLISLSASVLLLAAVSAFAQENHFFIADGVRIRYLESGTGEAIVLMHGAGGRSEDWMQSGVFQNLAATHRVIAYDQRGNGLSDKPRVAEQYGAEMALYAVRLLDHLGIQRAHFVGYSAGANLLGKLLTLRPERVISATLGGGAGRFDWTDEDTAEHDQIAAERERECVSRTLIYRVAPVDGPKPSEDEIQRRSKACLADPQQDRFALAAVVRGRKYEAITPAQAAAVTVPTLGIGGSLDSALAALQELKKLRPSLRLVVIDGASHTGATGAMRRAEFISGIRAFLADLRGTN